MLFLQKVFQQNIKHSIKALLACWVLLVADSSFATHKHFEFRVEDAADKNHSFSIQTIENQEFSHSSNQMANYGLQPYPIWIKVSFNYLTLHHEDRLYLSINFPPLDDIQVFIPKKWIAPYSQTQWQPSTSPNYVMKQLGDAFPFAQRDIISPNYIVDFKPDGAVSLPIYIRIATKSSLQAPISIFTSNEKNQAEISESLIYGAYFGLMLVMILYNGFIFLTTRLTAYLYYVLFNCALFVSQLANRGYAYQYLWPDSIWWNQSVIFIGSGLVFTFSSLFIRSFMDTKNTAPHFDKLLILGALLGLSQSTLTLMGFLVIGIKLSVIVGLFIPLTALTLGLFRLYQGDRRALLFVSAWAVLLLAAIAWHLTLSGVLAMTQATKYYLFIGSSIEVILLSLALADEINHQRRNALEHEQNEQRITLEKQAAENANRAKSLFLANISHELRTPLNAINGFTKRVLNTAQNSLSPKQMDALQTVIRSGEHLLQLVNNLIDLSQIESGKLKLNISSVSLNSVCLEVHHQLHPLLEHKPVQLIINLDSSLDPIQADPLRLKQVVINLVNNAIKFTRQGSITITTGQEVTEKAIFTYLKVSDTGSGISESHLTNIFERFQRGELDEDSERIDGYGLGLSLCKEIIERHQGNIRVNSKLGEGSVFTVRFPQKMGRQR
ncbi:MAG: sensor histidine kinase [Pseudomonadales bacterium]|nr:sensor histidine kinase [Pseudomonadales bacterium]